MPLEASVRPESTDSPSTKWFMLAIVTAGLIVMTINWFNIATGFGPISDEFDLSIASVALLISVFVAAYGLMHVPGGFLATRWGLRRTIALGLAIEGVGALLSAGAQNYVQLMVTRVVCGVGASIFAAVGIGAVSIWFRHKHHALALGISSAGFSVGTALGLYAWGEITQATSWRTSLVIGAAACLGVALVSAIWFRVPSGIGTLDGVDITREGLKQALGNRDVWRFGISFLGGYGAYVGGSQLISVYGEDRGIPGYQIALAAFVIGIAGVPGSLIGGWLADHYFAARKLFVVGAVLLGVFLIVVPLGGPATFWVPAFGIGFMFNFTFAVWQTIPGDTPSIAPEQIGTAIGLMLTVSAIGGFVMPWAFGLIAPNIGYGLAWAFMGIASIACATIALLRTQVPRQSPDLSTRITASQQA
ncbi:MFS transporter [Rhodococcus sp. ACT016]|uniref:MFS transporter n=1 Tax=Rhodococcus sp. ACT016 TaxID=3134808 RepID=UPI003D26F446